MSEILDPAEQLAAHILERLSACGLVRTPDREAAARAAPSPDECGHLVTTATWTEDWPVGEGGLESRPVTAQIWTAAIQAVLDRHGEVHIPARPEPYYLDGPLVLRSGNRLTADAAAEIRLRPGTDTCMVRNENVCSFHDGPVPEDLLPDTDILIEGGTWSTLCTAHRVENGNRRGGADAGDSVPGCHGVILLHNIRRVQVRDVTIRQSKPFGVHIGLGSEFVVDGLRCIDHGRDGVHVEAPASYGLIRDIGGTMRDDPVALNAWDWRQCASAFGPIHHILVEDVTEAPAEAGSTDAIRLLPGVKRFADGTTQACPVRDCVLRGLTDIREFKLYDQPNLELGRDEDSSAGLGQIHNVHFRDLRFSRPGAFFVHAEVDDLSIRDVELGFDPSASETDYALVEIGPPSMTYNHGSDDPEQWVEVFSPDLDCTVRNLEVADVRVRLPGGNTKTIDPYDLVRVVEQEPNPDYPNTIPRGGTGKGIWVRGQDEQAE